MVGAWLHRAENVIRSTVQTFSGSVRAAGRVLCCPLTPGNQDCLPRRIRNPIKPSAEPNSRTAGGMGVATSMFAAIYSLPEETTFG